ncbi:MAG: oligosaccharide flippase family protein [Clostridia bacterium]|nr:oligosaccharide flippase family protein [Clostridia bacterium]MBR0327832.1 oligosaccharide flippase family protein [Clostridia bacterium]
MEKTKRFLADTLIMTAVSLIMRTVAVSFNSYVTARIGAAGMGLYTLITSVYAFSVTLATSGINLGVTRTVAEALAKNRSAKKEMARALAYAAFFGSLAFFVLFLGAETIGRDLLADTRTIKSIRIFAVSLPFIALSSCFNGYFCAVRRTWKNAAAMLFEQAIKIFLSAALLTVLLPSGIEYACIALVLGGALAESASVLFAWLFYLFDKSRKTSAKTDGGSIRALASVALPVALSAYVRSALVTVEHMLIPRGLKKYGLDHEGALAAYGVLQGMALPVVLYPAAFSTAFAGLLVPEMTECAASNDKARLARLTERAIYSILVFAVCVSGIMVAEAYSISALLYPDTEAGGYVRCLALLIPVMYCDTVCDGILKGIGKQVYSMAVNIFDASLSVILVALFIPKYGITAYLYIIIGCEVINTALSLIKVLEATNARISPLRAVGVPFFAIYISARTVRAISLRLTPLPEGAELFCRIALCVFIYCGVLYALSALKKALPKLCRCGKINKISTQRRSAYDPDNRGKTQPCAQYCGRYRQSE